MGVVSGGGPARHLSDKEVALFTYLVTRSHTVVTREELYREVWSYSDRVVSRAVDLAVARLRSKIERCTADPDHILTVYGQGYRFVPVEAEEVPMISPAVPSLVGREADLARLQTAFEEGARLVTVTGPPGVGKTTLAMTSAKRWNRAVLCRLAEQRDRAGLVSALANALDCAIPSKRPLAGLARVLGRLPGTLVVLDNAEHLRDVVAESVTELLEGAPELQILVTSRERLSLSIEHRLDLGPLSAEAATQLYRQRLAGATASSSGEVDALVAWLDGMPLAIELAAAQADVLSEVEMLARMKSMGSSGADPAIVRALRWSWELLSPWEQAALSWCGVFSGGFAVSDFEAVWPAWDASPPAITLLTSLRAKSLLRNYEDPEMPGVRRLALYHAVRDFALSRLAEPATQDAVRVRGPEVAAEATRHHARHYGSMGTLEALRALNGFEEPSRMAALRVERHNLEAARTRSMEAGELGLAASATLALAELQRNEGRFDEVVAYAQPLMHSEALPPIQRVHLLRNAGAATQILGHIEEAAALLDRGIALADAAENPVLSADLKRFRAQSGLHRTPEEAMAACAEALGVLEREGATGYLEGAYFTMASLANTAGRQAEALDWARRALRASMRSRGPTRQAMCLYNEAFVLKRRGDFALAEHGYRRALEAFEVVNDRLWIAVTRAGLGTLYSSMGRLEEARVENRSALDTTLRHGLGYVEVQIRINLGSVLRKLGRYEAARETLFEARQAAIILDSVRLQCSALHHLAALHRDIGEPEVARRTWQEELDLATAASLPREEAEARAMIAALDEG